MGSGIGVTRYPTRMVIERSMHPQFLSNTYLVGQEGGQGFFVDAGGPVTPLVAAVERHEITPTHVLLTHHHHDHVAEVHQLKQRWPDVEVLIHPDEAELVEGVTGTMRPGEPIRVGGLEGTPLHTRGHTRGMLSLRVVGKVLPGDTLVESVVGGVRAPARPTCA